MKSLKKIDWETVKAVYFFTIIGLGVASPFGVFVIGICLNDDTCGIILGITIPVYLILVGIAFYILVMIKHGKKIIK